MSTDTSDLAPTTRIVLLTTTNATVWFRAVQSALGQKRVRYVIEDGSRAPAQSSPPTDTEIAARSKWHDNQVAVGILYDFLSPEHQKKDTVANAFDTSPAFQTASSTYADLLCAFSPEDRAKHGPNVSTPPFVR